MLTTVAQLPRRPATAETSSGVRTAAELMLTFSAPACTSRQASSSVRTPPPTVNGMKIVSDTRRTTSSMMSRPS
jgi:hypothetical protein